MLSFQAVHPFEVSYENEGLQNKSPKPLVPLRSSAPKVMKRKTQIPAPAEPRARSPSNLDVPGISRPRPRSPNLIPELIVRPLTPDSRKSINRSASPRSRSPKKLGGWL